MKSSLALLFVVALFACVPCIAQAQEDEGSQTGVHVLHNWLGDQCSFVPDLDVGFCCGAHDDAYANGGTERDRRRADRDFRNCIAEAGRPVVARIYFWGVRLFGFAFFNYGGA